jgi:hypothetical protein
LSTSGANAALIVGRNEFACDPFEGPSTRSSTAPEPMPV